MSFYREDSTGLERYIVFQGRKNEKQCFIGKAAQMAIGRLEAY